MQEYKLPKTKVWSKLSENTNKNFPTHGTSDPTHVPPGVGLTYINTTSKTVFISVGIASSSDWRLIAQD